MAEDKLRQSQYEYKANASLVLQTDRTLVAKVGRDEATGEVMSLVGKLSGSKLGDRASRAAPPEAMKNKHRKRRKQEQEDEAIFSRANAKDFVGLFYKPSTRETKQTYEVLLSFIQGQLGAVPRDVLYNAADEALAYLKDETLKDKEKKKEIEALISIMNDEKYFQLVTLGKKITDYSADNNDENEKGIDENIGVSIVFQDEEDGSEKEDDDDEDGVDAMVDSKLEGDQDNDDVDAADTDKINPLKIDAYWLQRELSVFYDALTSQKKSLEVLEILESDGDDREVENKLVFSLGYENFEFIRKLRKNRYLVLYCTQLAKAGNDAEKEDIEKKMNENPDLASVLAVLKGGDDGAASKAAADRKEASRKARMDEDLDVMDVDTEGGALGKNVLDLEDLSFSNGGHFMASRRCDLPEGTRKEDKQGYQEIHIPGVKPNSSMDLKCVKIQDMPEVAQLAFKNYNTLNPMQSKLFEPCMSTNENLLICAPTGAGKTNVAMMCILNELGKHKLKNGKYDLDAFKIVYISPMKSLVAEQTGSFGARLKEYGITVSELTGDSQLTKDVIDATQMLVCTPEKWDIVTRKGDDRSYANMVRLVIIDEIHLLHDERGPVLESIVIRTLRNSETSQLPTRIVGLSATLPNYEDVADFLHVKHETGLHFFDSSYRPVPLNQHFIGITEKKAIKRMKLMDKIVYDKVLEYAGKEQVLVFVHSRKDCGKTARKIRDTALENDVLGKFLKEGSASHLILREEADSVKDTELKDLLPYGFAMHHAGMSRVARTTVEELFADGRIQVLVSTATLAWGVNLPAHAVIIKGTQVYNPAKGAWVELSHLDVLQMLGRAGRPQYGNVGEGYLITSHQELSYYLSLQNVQLPVESQLVAKLEDNLNAEIVLGAVQNSKEAVNWLATTYLYIRMLRAPNTYGIDPSELDSDPTLLQRRADLIHTAATTLDKTNLIKYDRKTGGFMGTDLGRIASHYYIAHSTMATYNQLLKPTLTDIDLFRIFSLSGEFKQITVREEEKIELSTLLERVPIPVKESIEEPSAKVNCLLQAYISNLGLDGFALRADMVYVTQSAARLFRAIFEIVLRRGWAQLTLKCLNICKMIDRRMWQTMTPLRQFSKSIPADVLKQIERVEDFPFERFYDMTDVTLGNHVRVPKIGGKLFKCVHSIPKLELEATVQPITSNTVKVELTLSPDFQWDGAVHGKAQSFWIMVEDVDSELILHSEHFVLKEKFALDDHTLSFFIPIFDPMPPQYFIRIVSDRWMTTETVKPISFRHLILPEKAVPSTSLLDLQPLPFSALQNKKFEKLYKDFEYLNPIQTQVFSSLYSGNDNVLIGAPTGSGKTFCAEFAILNMLATNPDGRCVYVAPVTALAKQRFANWEKRFSGLGAAVVILTGDTTVDLKLLAKGKIIVATPEHWDMISRRWKQRKNVINTSLFIVDELHLIGGESGPVLEIVCARMRYIESQTEPESGKKIRMIGLSSSIAYSKEMASFLGVSSHNIFNFHPNVRPTPLEIHFNGFNVVQAAARLSIMSKPLYYAITKHSPKKPVIVCTPSRKQAQLTAVELMGFCIADNRPHQFLHCEESDLESYLPIFKDKIIKETIQSGIAYFHEGLNETEKEAIRAMYNANAIQVLVTTREVCWELNCYSHCTIVMDTQYYDGKEHRYIDYSILDMLQIIGSANRPQVDAASKAVILCQTNKKELYKKFLQEMLPVESHLNHRLHNHFVAEVVTKTIENKQDAVDYLTWTYFYRRLPKNANYYNMTGVTQRHISDHLSELVESTLQDLEESHCVEIENEMDIEAQNLGMISSYYYIQYTTIEVFKASLTQKTKIKGLIQIIAHAAEYQSIPVRQKEERLLKQLAARCPINLKDPRFNDPNTKAHLLLYAHFSRIQLSSELQSDLEIILSEVIRLIQACVDVLSSEGWLKPALAAMDLAQMVVQGVWDSDPYIKQIPHFTKAVIDRCKEAEVEGVFDIMEMEDDAREDALRMDSSQMQDVARYCNRYPSVDVAFEIAEEDDIHSGDDVIIMVQLDRDDDEEGPVDPVVAPYYPTRKDESWWVVVGDKESNSLVTLKRVPLQRQAKVKLTFEAPAVGTYKYKLFVVCDSYLGADQEYNLKLNVKEKSDSSSEEESDSE